MANKRNKVNDRFVPPIMRAFRDAFEKRDAAKPLELRAASGEAIISGRRATPRNSVSEAVLKQELADDLSALLNTVNLESAVDMEGLDDARSSIINFGIDDLTSISVDSREAQDVGQRLEQVLRDHEDRLVEGSVRLAAEAVTVEASARIAVHINADMFASPADVPVEFVADVESYSGKVRVKQA